MRLEADWETFLLEINDRWPKGARVYLERRGGLTYATAAQTDQELVIIARLPRTLESVDKELKALGHETRRGRWADDNEPPGYGDVWIAAIAYQADDKKPGLWVDAFPYPPNASHALSTLLEEFNEDGTLEQVDNDAFQSMAHPNLIILTPADIQAFVARHAEQADLRETTLHTEDPQTIPLQQKPAPPTTP